jgi:hypothetical protein
MIASPTRRELAVLEGGTVTAWWTVGDTAEAAERLRLAAGALARYGDPRLRWESTSEPADPVGPGVVVARTSRVEVNWVVDDMSGKIRGRAAKPCVAEKAARPDMLDAIGRSLADVPVPSRPRNRDHHRALAEALRRRPVPHRPPSACGRTGRWTSAMWWAATCRHGGRSARARAHVGAGPRAVRGRGRRLAARALGGGERHGGRGPGVDRAGRTDGASRHATRPAVPHDGLAR